MHPRQMAYRLKKFANGIEAPCDRLLNRLSLCSLAKRRPLTLGLSSTISNSRSSSGSSLGPSALFHQPNTQPPPSPPAKPSKIDKGTGYPKKKKLNRKNNHNLNAVPVENSLKKLAWDFLPSFLSLITSHQMKGTNCPVLYSQEERP